VNYVQDFGTSEGLVYTRYGNTPNEQVVQERIALLEGAEAALVLASGMGRTVRELVDLAFSHVGLDYREFVVSDPKLYRPAEVDLLLADPSKARRELGWSPKIGFAELVAMMVDADLERLGSGDTVASARGAR